MGKTTGWIHRTTLQHKKVEMIGGVTYEAIDDQGLHIKTKEGSRLLAVDSIIVCAGQVSLNALYQSLKKVGITVHLIGGAYKAAELDAKNAIEQACRLAALI